MTAAFWFGVIVLDRLGYTVTPMLLERDDVARLYVGVTEAGGDGSMKLLRVRPAPRSGR